MKKRLLSAILIVAAAIVLLCVPAFADGDTVDTHCGDTLTWTLSTNGILTVSGTGDMYDYTLVPHGNNQMSTAPWAEYSTYIDKIVIGSGVTSIGRAAFYGLNKVTAVTFGGDLTLISPSAFENCVSLRSLTMGRNVRIIGEWAFAGCESIENIVLNDGLRNIGAYAFYNCSGATSVSLPTTLDTLGVYAFAQCRELTNISIPSGVKTISECCFADCSQLVIATIPNTVENIQSRAFYNCSAMSIVSIPTGLKTLGEYAFYHCSQMSSVAIPEGVESIGAWTFGHCSALKTLIVSDSVKSIAKAAFYGCSDIENIRFDGTLAEWDAINASNRGGYPYKANLHTSDYELIIAHAICGDDVMWTLDSNGTLTISGTGAMDNYDVDTQDDQTITAAPWGDYIPQIKKLVITSGVTAIGDSAFYGCSAITSVQTPDTLETIGDNAFRGCTSLKTVSLGSGVKTIAYRAFFACESLTTINIPESTETIGEGAFCYCAALTKITIPDKVKSIEQWTFYYCSSLTKVTLGAKIESIGNSAFSYCSELTSVTIPQNVSEIKEWAFGYCDKLKTVHIGARVKTVGNYAFCGCTSLTDVFYSGAKYQWEAINTGTYNEPLIYAILHTTKLDVPDVTVTNNSDTGKIVVKWNSVPGADSYEVWRATTKNGTYSKISTTSKLSLTNSSATIGETYYYKVKSISSDPDLEESVLSSAVSGIYKCARPVITVTNASTGKITVKWSEIKGASKYYVYRATSKSGTYSKVATVTTTSYTDSGGTLGKTYYYKVKAISESGSDSNSSYSTVMSATKRLPKPTVKISLSSNKPKLSWSAVDGATSYIIYRSTSKSGTYTKFGTTTKTSYVNSSASKGTTYYYKVVAVTSKSSTANSAYSSVVSIKAN